MLLACRAAERGGANCPEVLGAPGNFLLDPSHFCGLNRPRKGQDICFFGLNTEIWYDKVPGKHVQRPEKFFP